MLLSLSLVLLFISVEKRQDKSNKSMADVKVTTDVNNETPLRCPNQLKYLLLVELFGYISRKVC